MDTRIYFEILLVVLSASFGAFFRSHFVAIRATVVGIYAGLRAAWRKARELMNRK